MPLGELLRILQSLSFNILVPSGPTLIPHVSGFVSPKLGASRGPGPELRLLRFPRTYLLNKLMNEWFSYICLGIRVAETLLWAEESEDKMGCFCGNARENSLSPTSSFIKWGWQSPRVIQTP